MMRASTKRNRLVLFSMILLAVLCYFSISYSDQEIKRIAQGKLFEDINLVPHGHVGLLLGTGKFIANGDINPYYSNRIEAAVKLLSLSKIDYLIISGDNGQRNYNEPRMMKDDLIALGIDSTKVYLDYAGFRTFDSMIRLQKVFDQDSVTVISQQFHNERAIYIANRIGVYAIGYNAKDVLGNAGFKTRLREKLARVKVFLDFWTDSQPKFLGEHELIP